MEYAPLSPLGMLVNAGPVSKIVMLILLAASVWTWVLILDAIYVVWRISNSLREARDGGQPGVLWPIEDAGEKAIALHIAGESARTRRARVFGDMRRAASELLADARGGLGNLAIVSSVGPFVGLFGTVWGIMSSFGAIAQTQETGLTVVAPGIAEALAATAYGLAAAIPAAIGYNRLGATFSRLDEELRRHIGDLANSKSFATRAEDAKTELEVLRTQV